MSGSRLETKYLVQSLVYEWLSVDSSECHKRSFHPLFCIWVPLSPTISESLITPSFHVCHSSALVSRCYLSQTESLVELPKILAAGSWPDLVPSLEVTRAGFPKPECARQSPETLL